MRKLLLVGTSLAFLASVAIAQEKQWSEWSKAEAEKILNHSPWGQTQVETDTSEMVYRPTTSGSATRAERGATNQAISVNYHIRLLSAKPVRLAFMRVITLAQKKPDADLMAGLNAFVQRDFKDFIVVAITFDSVDARFSGPALQAFGTARAGTLKNLTYLERKDGKRVFLMDYHPPIQDGLGAKFIFPRRVDERDFLTAESGTVRFYCELTPQIKLNVTFKLSDMMYEGKLEY